MDEGNGMPHRTSWVVFGWKRSLLPTWKPRSSWRLYFLKKILENVNSFGDTGDSEDEITSSSQFRFFNQINIQTFQDI